MAEYNSREDIERVVGWAQSELDLLSLRRAAIAMRVRVIKNTIVGLADVFGSTLTDEELRTASYAPCSAPRSFLSRTYTSMSSDVDGVFDTPYNSRAVSQDRRNKSRSIDATKGAQGFSDSRAETSGQLRRGV